MTQNVAPSSRLSAVQHNIIDLLLVGKSVTDVAAAANRSRKTIQRWLYEDPYFIAEYNRRQNDLAAAREQKTSHLSQLALEIIEENLQNTRDPKLALSLLKALPPTSKQTQPAKLCDEELVMHRIVEELIHHETEKSQFHYGKRGFSDFMLGVAVDLEQIIRNRYGIASAMAKYTEEADESTEDIPTPVNEEEPFPFTHSGPALTL